MSRAGPVTPMGTVVVNSVVDTQLISYRQSLSKSDQVPDALKSDTSKPNFNVMPRELAFTLGGKYDSKIGRLINSRETDPRIFTSANNLPYPGSNGSHLEDGEKLREMRRHIRFVGVPLTAYDAANLNQKDNIACTVAGMTTITNTGPFHINIGDLVMWDVPGLQRGETLPRSSGNPRTKLSFVTMPLDCSVGMDTLVRPNKAGNRDTYHLGNYVEDLFEVVFPSEVSSDRSAKKAKPDDNEEMQILQSLMDTLLQCVDDDSDKTKMFRNSLRMFLKGFHGYILRNNSRVIGRALRSAESGQEFDVLLRCAF